MTRRSLLAGALFLAPAAVFLGAFVLYPAVATGYRSLFDRAGSDFVGIDNYRAMLELDRTRTAVRNSLIWVGAFPILVVGLGLVLAVLAERITWRTAFKTVLFLPMAISLLASGVIWRIVYEADPDRGVLNAVLDVPRELVSPTGRYPGAVPSTPGVVQVDVPPQGGAARLGFVRVAADDVPDEAVQARLPPARPGALAGVVWRDVKPGADEKGQVEDGELGMPGVTVELVGTDGSSVARGRSGPDGAFVIEDVPAGRYEARVDAGPFRPPWRGVRWLGEALVTPAAIMAAVWVWAGFSLVTIGAGLAAIDRQLLEAARVDGGSEWQVFRRVTVPLLAPVLGVVFITMTINALKMFDLVFAVAPGSVQDEANVIGLEMWRTAFTGAGDRGLGAAIAVLLFVLVLPVLAFNIRRFRIEEGRR